MDFIIDNYLWFIVGGVVLVMALIGYIAEKTDFGRKGKSEKKKAKEENNIQEQQQNASLVVEPIKIDDSKEFVIEENNQLNKDSTVNTPVEVIPQIQEEDLTVPLNQDVEEDLNPGFDKKEEELITGTSLENLDQNNNEGPSLEPINVEEIIGEEQDQDNIENEKTEEIQKDVDSNNYEEEKTPNNEALKDNDPDEEDVWRF